jgi:uncharacterized protein (UPF0335 family)
MKNNDLYKNIERLEKEIQYLYHDYKKMLGQHESFNDIKTVRIKIKQAEESLRLKKRILYISLN